MTQTPNRLMDEFAKLMNDAAGAAQGVKREVETAVRGQMERFLGDMDVVQREEFEAVREMAVKAREENDALRHKVEALEAQLTGAAPKAKKPAARKPAASKATAAKTASKSKSAKTAGKA
ncbi:MAG: accessory factor UbiK family protein [Hyphomicrobiales bacterium]|nr:accessory factor UbiK family protein [Hyphomicrobiales bacterium]